MCTRSYFCACPRPAPHSCPPSAPRGLPQACSRLLPLPLSARRPSSSGIFLPRALPSSGSPVFTPTGRLLRDIPGSEFPVVSPLGHLGDVFGSHGPPRCCRDLRPPREEAQGAVPVSVTLTSASGFRWCPPRFLPPVGHPLPFTVHRSLVGRRLEARRTLDTASCPRAPAAADGVIRGMSSRFSPINSLK